MGMTVTNINTLQLLNIVNRTSTKQSNVLTQLSTGLKINKASDNPAGLISMENLNAELTAVTAALDNNQRADAMVSTAEGGLDEVSSLLSEIQTLAMASVNDSSLSQAEIQANQAQIDSALEAIDRIANTTTFNGKQLLNGSQAIRTSQATDTAENVRVFTRGSSSADVIVSIETTTQATSAVASFDPGGALTEDHEIVITGALGSQTVSLGSGDDQAAVLAKINAASAATGVDAVADGATGIELQSSSVGSEAYVEMTVLSGGDFASQSRSYGTDAVLTVNGRSITADGSDVYYSANGLSLSFSLSSALNTTGATETITVLGSSNNGGGMTFQLGVDSTTRTTIGIDSTACHMLGGGDAGAVLSDLKSGGSADLASKTANTLKAVRKAITQVAAAKGRIGGFQKFQLQTSMNSLTQMQESLTSAKSVVADTDYAAATAELNRQSVLLNSGISLLGLANQQASQILSLLG